ncbi:MULTISPECIES: hypothetical protein [Pseudoalteromonas]|uniref:HlyD family efflux transporter periplasmic adaptor subunit n=1 Tax=Pseudoalteromonas fuliginea TaxID=1872678 RepID=A0ABQ6RLK5_9GAMM|nr:MULTISPECIES: hypothetical protein [Pseudoalteromonas]ATG79117.1 hypothetical protein AOR04_17075 [Pseudoalteromonas sp. 1_2015MBL_MicDiv]KAA1163362.1 hypothetical protein EU509_03825 [Pseudoalteromonas fuliginea]KAA1168647.1 hypothetical protein EUZ79_04325 [Pseudoalteromonas fuliginea]
MSIVNMFRKEALRNQYKSSDIGKSLIKQPKIINNSIFILIAIFLFSFFIINILTFSTSKNLSVKVSPENYTPIIYNEVIIINKHLATSGESVKKDQKILSISKLNNESELNTDFIRSPIDGFFFHSETENNITKPFEPLGYILNTPLDNELSFWILKNEKTNININDKVKIIANEDILNGIVTMIIGNKSNDKEKKVYLKLETRNYTQLSPSADIKILLTQQSEKVINLIK